MRGVGKPSAAKESGPGPGQAGGSTVTLETRRVALGVHGVVELVRPGNLLMAGAGALIGALVASGLPLVPAVGWAAGATVLVTAGGNALNDFVDAGIDADAHPERPIPSGRLSRGVVAGLGIAWFVAALGLGWLAGARVFWVVLAAEALLLGYEGVWKAKGWVGNGVVALLVAATFVAGALAAGGVSVSVGVLAGLAFVANVGREVWKDAEDAAFDVGRETVAQRWGVDRAMGVARGVTLVGVVLSPFPFVFGFGGWPYVGLVGVADAVFLAAVVAGEPGRAQRFSKFGMLLALVAFAVGGIV